MKKVLFLFFITILASSCMNNNEDYGDKAYKNKDYTKALVLAGKGCKDKNGEACYMVANIYYMGLSHQIDHVQAARYYIKSCDIGNGRACYMLGKIYSDNVSIPQDIYQSGAYYRKSNKILIKECNSGNAESCLYAGALYLYGYGVAHDTNKAVSYFDKSCKLQFGAGCYTLGFLYSKGYDTIKEDKDLSNNFMNLACKYGYNDACSQQE